METPPTYAPPKKSNTGLIIGLVLGGIAICCIGGVALLGFFGFNFFKNTLVPIAECVGNYEIAADAMVDYADAHDGKLPSAAAWQDELAPYVEKRVSQKNGEKMPFKLLDPKGEWSCSMGDKKTNMAFNSDLAGTALSEARQNNKIVIFEVEQMGRNVSQPYVARDKSTSPKMMGERRGWVTIDGSGEVRMGGQSMKESMK